MDYVQIWQIIGQVLFGGFFVMSGLMHFKKMRMMVEFAEKKKVPYPGFAVIVTGLLLLIGGLAVLVWGYGGILSVADGATLLLIFLIPTTLIMHNFWAIPDSAEKMKNMHFFMSNTALIGALFLVIASTI